MSLLRRLDPSGSPVPAPSTPQPTTSSVEAPAPARRPAQGPGRDLSLDIKTRVQNELIGQIDPKAELASPTEIRKNIRILFDQIIDQQGIIISRNDRERLFEEIAADIVGFGPLEPLLADDSVTEIMVNGPNKVYVERKGKLERTAVQFANDEHVRKIIDKIIAPLGRRCDESSPMVDARLPDGSRVNAVIPPLALDGPSITIRKFFKKPLTVEALIQNGTMTTQLVEFLQACVEARLNIIVAGGTGSGKTTLLNVMSSFIPDDERIVTIEDAAELQLRQDHVVRLETRKANVEGKGAITIRDLVINSLRMRPERIVVGECRGGEALDMLVAMNTGHDGSLTTLHANSPKDVVARLEVMCLMAGMELPLKAIREQISSAIQLIVFQERLKDGSRRIGYVTEVCGIENEMVKTQHIFKFEQTGIVDGKIQGYMKGMGVRPTFTPMLERIGLFLPDDVFGIGPGSAQ